MRILLRVTTALALTALLAGAANAQDTSPDSKIVLPPVIVSATTVPTPADQIASSVTVITAQDIARDQLRTLPDALRTVPGLNVVQTGGPGGQTAIFMRGTNSNHVKVFLDGIDISDPSTPNGSFDYAHLLTGDIERIEVLRGPQSGLYGSDAIGGVISITTKKGNGPPKVSATVEGGSLGTFNQTTSLSGAQSNINYSFNVLHYRSTDIPVTPTNLLAPGEKRNNNSYDNWTYSTKLGADLTDNLAVNAVGRYTDAKLLFTGDDGVNFLPSSAPEVQQDTQVNRKFFGRGEAVWTLLDGKFKNFFGVNYTNQAAWNSNPNPDSFNPFGAVAPPSLTVGDKTNYNWRGEAKVASGQTLVLGAEREVESLWTNSTADAAGVQTTTTATNGNKAGYVELQSAFANRLFLVSNVRTDDNDSFGSHTTWRLAPAFLVPGTDTKLKATYGTGFKAPTLTELFVNNAGIGQIANPNLKSETSKGYDFGFEQPLMNGRYSFGVTYFHNDITNLINTQSLPAFMFIYYNVGEAESHGIETFASAGLTDQLNVRADYTRTFTQDEATGLGLARQPGEKMSLTTIWTPVDRLTISTTVLYVSSWIDVNRDTDVFIPRLNAPPYATVNVAANYKVDEHVTVFGRVDNLLDRTYQVPYGFLAPGLGIYGGVRVSN
jgi:vitamin B12 transporter